MAKPVQKVAALAMRRNGRSIKEIAKTLGVGASSVSLWVRDMQLTDTQKNYLRQRQIVAGNAGRMKGAQVNREMKQQRIIRAKEEAAVRLKDLSGEALFFCGLGLYWGEGAKADSDGSLAIINSDPRVIVLMMRWFEECFGVERARYMPRVFISDTHRDREEVITDYWVKILGLPRSQFRRMIFLAKGKKIYENRNVYYGVLALRVAKGTDIRYKILAQIDRLASLVT